ncbi:MAG: metal ABC transporter ATP-binding protein [Methanotrichaceae archaeon]
MNSIVSIENLWVHLDGQVILEDVNLKINERDFLGLIGPNGGGKSTLLKVILGLIKPSRGRVTVFGTTPTAARKMVGYLPQKSLFDQSFPVTALDVVLMGRYSRRGSFRRYTSEDRETSLRALEAVGMSKYAHRDIGAFSGGQQQRIFVARSFVSNPKLLLLDEPTAGIDAAQRKEFYELLSRLNKKMAIVMVSHDISAVSKYVEKIACVSQKLYHHGSKELTTEDVEEAYRCPVDMIAHGVPHRVLREHD